MCSNATNPSNWRKHHPKKPWKHKTIPNPRTGLDQKAQSIFCNPSRSFFPRSRSSYKRKECVSLESREEAVLRPGFPSIVVIETLCIVE